MSQLVPWDQFVDNIKWSEAWYKAMILLYTDQYVIHLQDMEGRSYVVAAPYRISKCTAGLEQFEFSA